MSDPIKVTAKDAIDLLNERSHEEFRKFIEWQRKEKEEGRETLGNIMERCLIRTGILECSHDFVAYTGLTETYEYCKKCDVKR